MLIAVPDSAVEVVACARAAGIEHIVVVSSAAVTAGHDTTYNLPVERAVQASGLDWSIVRPGEFATNALLIWGPSIRSGRRVVEPFPDQAGNPIHEQDIADVIVADLLEPDRRGRVDTIIGPDTLTKREQVARIAAAVGDDIALDEVTPEQALRFYREQGGFAADNAGFGCTASPVTTGWKASPTSPAGRTPNPTAPTSPSPRSSAGRDAPTRSGPATTPSTSASPPTERAASS